MTTVRPVWIVLLAPWLTFELAGCSSLSGGDDPNSWYNKTIVENIAGRSPPPPDIAAPAPPSSGTAASPAPGAPPPGALVPPDELYRSDGSCGGMMLGPGGSSGGLLPASGGVSLEMTECDVARRAGPPDKVEVSPSPGGERFLTLSYLRGPGPRIYHFASGRLVSIENLPAPAPQKRARP
jgi:hypothetical protein